MITELTKKDILLETLSQLDFSNEPQFATELRAKSKSALAELDFPTSKTEYWKYTRVGKIINKNYTIQKEVSNKSLDISSFLIPDLDANVVVIENGFYRADLAKINAQDGVKIDSLKNCIANSDEFIKYHLGSLAKVENEIFIALNTLAFTDGVYIGIEKNTIASKPIHIINIVTENGLQTNTRTVVKAHDSSSVKIVETFVKLNAENTFSNSVAEFFLNPNSKIEYNKIQDKKDNNYHIATEEAHQRADSTFTINTAIFNGAIVRNNLNIAVNASNCETNLNGLYLGKNQDHIDNHTVVDHLKPHCNSFEVYKGVLDDESTGVFNGKVFVRQDAQITNAFQQNNTILLTDTANSNSKPELEIYADDVKCSHGSTTGQIDDEAIFYLQSRGISRRSALNLMINAFAKDALEKITLEPLQTYIDLKIEERFTQ
jgi:Fe-S cluster assembly protein SufD